MNEHKKIRQWGSTETEQASLLREAAYYQSWVQQSPYAIITFDENGRVLFWNAAASNLLGYTADEAISHDLSELIIPVDERHQYKNNLTGALEKGQALYLGKASLLKLMSKTGNEFIAEVSFIQTQIEEACHFTAIVRKSTETDTISVENLNQQTELEQREKQLEEVGILFKSIVEDAPFPMWITDNRGNPVFLNQAWRDFIGPVSAEPLNIDWSELIPPEDLSTVQAEYYAALEQQATYRGEFRMRRFDGQYRWVHCVVNPRNGHLNAYIGSFVDITDRKLAEQTLEGQEMYSRMLIDAIPVLIWKSDIEAHCNFFNKNWLDFTGRTMKEEQNYGWAANVHPDDIENFNRIYLSAFQSLEKFRAEYRLKRQDGQYRWMMDTGVPLFSPSGEFEGYIGSCVDITERKQAEQILQESEERFHTMADAAPVSIGVYDEHGEAIYFNRTTLDFLNLPMEDILGNKWQKYIYPADLPHLMEVHSKASAEHKEYACEFRAYRADGAIRHLYRTAAPRFKPNGEFLGEICVSVDVTEQRIAVERLRRMFEANIIGAAVWSRDERIVQANEAFLDMLGYTVEQMHAGLINWRTITPPEYRALDDACLRQIAETGICPPYEKQYIHKDGHRVDVLMGSAGMEDNTGEGVALVLDITQRRKNERDLHWAMQREKILRHTLELTVKAADWAYEHKVGVDLQLVAEAVGQFYQVDRCLIISYVDELRHPGLDILELLGQYCVPDIFPLSVSDLPEQALIQHQQPLTALHEIHATNPDQIEDVLKEKLSRLDIPEEVLKESLQAMKYKLCEYFKIQSFLRIPIIYRNKSYGTVALHQCRSARVWTPQEVELLRDIAEHIGNAFYQAELQAHERRAREALEKSYNLIRIINEAQGYFITREDPYKIFETLLNQLLAHTESQFGFIGEVLYSADKMPYMKTIALSNIAWNAETERLYEEYKRKGMEFRKLESLYGRILTSGKLLISNNPMQDPRRGGLPAGHPPLTAFMGIPVYDGNEMIGLVGVANRPDGYDEAMAQDLQPYITACATLIDGTRNEALRKKLTRDLRVSERALKNYATKLERSNRDLDQFATIASHDLQAPLRKVFLFSEFLKSSAGDKLPLECYDYIERIQKAISRMQTLISDLLVLSRVNRRGKPFLPVDLGDVIREVLADLESLRQEVNGTIQVGPTMTIDADDIQMHQILQNLIDNALKFHKPDVPPEVYVEVIPADEQNCEIIVRDNGIGFDEKHLNRIFEVFERLHGESQYEGTGMGLAIVRKIVERHGGSITARSAPDQGATFIVTLPIHQAQS